MTRRIQILIVEDEPRWSTPLQTMYSQSIQGIGATPIIQIASTSEQAANLLRSQKFDLLSLDVNLNEEYPCANWEDLLRMAKDNCTAVIITTGISQDPTFTDIAITLNEKAVEIFGNNIIYRQKPINQTTPAEIAKSIEQYRQQLTPAKLEQLVERPDIKFWKILLKAIAASSYIVIPNHNPWAESDRFTNIVTRDILMKNIAAIYKQSEEACHDWHKHVMSNNRIAWFKWLASILKVTGASLFALIGILHHPSAIAPGAAAIIGGFSGMIIGGVFGLIIYSILLTEICLKSIGHFGRNYTA
jgi:CheY-like chemotaxis protein